MKKSDNHNGVVASTMLLHLLNCRSDQWLLLIDVG